MTESGDRVIGPSGEVKSFLHVHVAYLLGIAALIVVGIVVANSAIGHARADAQRDAVIDAQKSNISDLEHRISNAQQAAQAQIAALEQQKQQVIASPATAPTIIREVIPEFAQHNPDASKANQAAPTTPQQGSSAQPGEPPDSPGYVMTQQDQQQLAQFIIGCKQCAIEREQLQSQVADQQQVIDAQKTELTAAMKAAKGGSVWQRTKKAFKWLAIGAVAGATAVEAAHR